MPPMKRLELHNALVETVSSKHVYFQPPESVKLSYPCVVYKLDNKDTYYADDKPYADFWRYIVTYITKNPDDPVVEELAQLPASRFDRYFVADNLHHYSFVITMS